IDETKMYISEERFGETLLEEYVGQNLVLGIRAEDVIESRNERKDALKAKIEVQEHMGAEVLVYIDYKGQKIVSKISSDVDSSLRREKNVTIRFKTEKIQLFEKNTKISLLDLKKEIYKVEIS